MDDIRNHWAHEWASMNPILRNGEPGYDKTSGRLKVGNGYTRWVELNFLTGDGAGSSTANSTNTYVALVGAGTADDTAQLNALLTAARNAGGGLVKGTPGQTYTISAPLVIGTNTVLDMTGCVVQLNPNAVEGTMLIDTGHNAMLYQGGSWLAPQKITVLGGHWQSGNVQGATVNGRHRFILGGNRITVRGCRYSSTSGKYQLCLQNISDFVIDDVFMDTVESDGVHIQGPAVRGRVTGVRGTSHDDLVSITPCDWSQYAWGNEGDVSDILIDGVQGIDCRTNLVKVLSGTTMGGVPINVRRIIVRNITGNLVTGANFGAISGVYIGDDTAQATTMGGRIYDVLLDGLSIQTLPNLPIVIVPGNETSKAIDSLIIRNVYMQSDCAAAVKIEGGSIASLIVDGLTGGTVTTPITEGLIWFYNTVSRAKRVRLSNVDLSFAGAKDGALVKAPWATNALDTLAVVNAYLSNVAQGFDLGTSSSIRMVNVRLVGNDMICNVRASAVLAFSGSSIDVDNTWLNLAAGAQVRTKSFDFPSKASFALTPQVGDRMYNMDAGVAGGLGPCMYTGTAWQRVV